MRTPHIILLCLALCFGTSTQLQAQTKRKLKAALAQAKRENDSLRRAYHSLNIELEETDRLRVALAKENSSLRLVNQRLLSDKSSLEDEILALKQNPTQPLPPTSDSYTDAGSGPIVYRDSSITCESVYDQLALNTTYSLNYEPMDMVGWGVQIYAFSSLCQAENKAYEFNETHTGYLTFIRVKEVRNRRYYAIICGSMSNRAEARNYRDILRDEALYDAFVIRL